MNVYFSRSLALAVVIGAITAQASAQTLTDNIGSTSSSNGNYTITSLKAKALASTSISSIPLSAFYNGLTQWNATLPMNQQWSLNLVNTALMNFTMVTYKPTMSANNVGDLVCDISYQPGAGAPAAISRAGRIPGSAAVWSQSVLTNVPLAGAFPGGMNGYLDCLANRGNAPAYPYQYVTSEFWDDPSRSGQQGKVVTWTGDAYLSTLNYTTHTLTVYGGVEWGFTITPNARVAAAPEADDFGNVDPNLAQAVPEPAPTAVLGMGLVGLSLLRRRKKA